MCIKYKVSKNRIESCIDRKAADLCLAWKSSTMLESASWSEYIMIIIIYDDDSPEIYFTDWMQMKNNSNDYAVTHAAPKNI